MGEGKHSGSISIALWYSFQICLKAYVYMHILTVSESTCTKKYYLNAQFLENIQLLKVMNLCISKTICTFTFPSLTNEHLFYCNQRGWLLPMVKAREVRFQNGHCLFVVIYYVSLLEISIVHSAVAYTCVVMYICHNDKQLEELSFLMLSHRLLPVRTQYVNSKESLLCLKEITILSMYSYHILG